MKKHQYTKLGLIACAAVFAASVQVRAADMAWASGAIADVYVAMTEAYAAWADAAGRGTKAINEAQAAIDDVVAAATDALKAYKEMEAAGDGDAAAATEALRDAQQRAQRALGHAVPAPTPSEGGYKLPNPGRVVWESDGLQKLYEELFNIAQAASAQGGTEFVDTDATRI